jgi:predicted permease
MNLFSRLRSWLSALLKRNCLESEIDSELRFHIDAYMEDLVRTGVPRPEAVRRAHIEFGAIEAMKEECREARGAHILTTFLQDLRFGVRMLGKNPGFATVSVLTLALGIGANTAIFSLINGVMLSSIPVRDPQALVSLKWSAHQSPYGGYSSFGDCNEEGGSSRGSGCSFSYPMFGELREKGVFFGVAAFAGPNQLAVAGNGAASIAQAEFVSGDYFQTLGVEAVLGRTLQIADERKGAEPVAVVSYGYWQSAFGGMPSAIGKVIRLNGVPFSVVGVIDSRFTRLSPGKTEDMWLSIAQAVALKIPWARNPQDPASAWLTIVGRLRPFTSASESQAAASLLFRNAMVYGPKPLLKESDDPRVTVFPAQKGLKGIRQQLGTPLYLLMGAVGVVLLIACANVAGLLLSRAAARRHEIAVRLALGAGRPRLVRQLLTESILLSAIGAALGIMMAAWAVHAIGAFLLGASPDPHAIDVHPDLRVLAFTVGIAGFTAMLSGLVPALRGTRVAIAPMMNPSTGSLLGSSAQSRGGRLRAGNMLVVAQVALSVLVLVFAGLFLRTLRNLQSANPGFETANILTFGIDPTQAGYDEPRIQRLYQDLQQRLSAIPGVLSASYSSDVLLSGGLWTGGVRLQGAIEKSSIHVQMLAVGPQFFETLCIPLLAGRGFSSLDFASRASVAVVNQAFARRYFAGRSAVGEHLLDEDDRKTKQYEILGVVADTKYYEMRQGEEPTVYVPVGNQAVFFSLRTAQNPAAAILAIKQIASELDSNLPVFAIRTQTQAIDQTLVNEQLIARLSTLFGVLAIVLASIGLYGLLSYEVSRRTRELGIRAALGAQRGDVLRMVVTQGFALTLVGAVAGLALAAALTRYLESLLYGIKPTDPLTFSTVVLLLITVAALACAVPARRATRVDPIVALRYE